MYIYVYVYIDLYMYVCISIYNKYICMYVYTHIHARKPISCCYGQTHFFTYALHKHTFQSKRLCTRNHMPKKQQLKSERKRGTHTMSQPCSCHIA